MTLGLASTAACDSLSLLPGPPSEVATLMAFIKECEHTTGRDTRRLVECLPVPPPDLTLRTLSLMEGSSYYDFRGESTSPGIDAFLEELASEAEDPVLRAAAATTWQPD